MNTVPKSAVAMIQIRNRRWSPRWIAARASTIVSELISRMNDVTDVNGMLYTSAGCGVFAGERPRYSRYVEMNAPKKMHSDDRNTHIASWTLVVPVLVSARPCTTWSVGSWSGTGASSVWAIV